MFHTLNKLTLVHEQSFRNRDHILMNYEQSFTNSSRTITHENKDNIAELAIDPIIGRPGVWGGLAIRAIHAPLSQAFFEEYRKHPPRTYDHNLHRSRVSVKRRATRDKLRLEPGGGGS